MNSNSFSETLTLYGVGFEYRRWSERICVMLSLHRTRAAAKETSIPFGTPPRKPSQTRWCSCSTRAGATYARLLATNACLQRIRSPTTGAASSAPNITSTTACPVLVYKRHACFRPGIVTFSTSSLSLIRGAPAISTSLYTHPSAGCRRHVTRCVPIPNAVMAWPCCFSECNTSSWISFDAVMPKPANPPARLAPRSSCVFVKISRDLRER
mmetsp:Transcript_4218/g.15525  ORF Transcript_4218/g.15525 Transcript_4218/m.15525 type:complete len:211 (-) Transcript_4218:1265-1897(-)